MAVPVGSDRLADAASCCCTTRRGAKRGVVDVSSHSAEVSRRSLFGLRRWKSPAQVVNVRKVIASSQRFDLDQHCKRKLPRTCRA